MNLNKETLQELHKTTVQRFIKGREQQADIAWDHSQTAKKAWLGNSRKTGIWDPVVPRVVGQIGKIGQHDDALLRTATIFDKRSEKAKASADKAKLRLIKQSGKRAATMQNEEYTQILEQMILSLTGMELEELHEAVGGHLKEGTGYSAEEVKSGKQPSGRRHPEARFPGWKVGKNMLTQKVKNVKKK